MKFRLAESKDADWLFRLRNSKLREGQKLYTKESSARADKSCNGRLWVAEDPEFWNEPMGTIFYEKRGEDYFGIPWAITPELREKGVGRSMVEQAVKFFRGPFIAKILPENVASVRCAEHAGYRYRGMEDGFLIFRKGFLIEARE